MPRVSTDAMPSAKATVPAETSYYPALEELFNEVGARLATRIYCVVNIRNRGADRAMGFEFLADQPVVRALDLRPRLVAVRRAKAVDPSRSSNMMVSVPTGRGFRSNPLSPPIAIWSRRNVRASGAGRATRR
jgi:hypothetical protein